MPTTATKRRFTRGFPCPICSGCDELPRGAGVRCSGFLSGDGWAHCSREQHAGGLAPEANGTFAHRMDAPCRCGTDHRAGGPALPVPSRPADRPRIARTRRFEIRDINDVVQAIHVRDEGDDGKKVGPMPWQGPDGTSGLAGRDVNALPLYRTEHLAAAPADRPVILTEGEAKADRLATVAGDAVAVCGTVTGSGGLPNDDVLRVLIGRAVFCWADNDDTGKRHMNDIAARFVALGAPPPKMIEWADAPPKGDAAD